MIFLTVGNNTPFNRLVRTVDNWASSQHRNDVVAQIGINGWCPKWIRYVTNLDPDDYHTHMKNASLVVSHAGIGTILSTQQLGKPLIVMPRRGDLRETRNNHQIATSRQFRHLSNLWVAEDENELVNHLNHTPYPTSQTNFSMFAEKKLIDVMQEFIKLCASKSQT